jgi:hypothetical protein
MTAANRSIRCCGTLRSWLLLFPLAFFFTAGPFVGVAPEIFSGSNEDRHLCLQLRSTAGGTSPLTARGSATESAALLDVCYRLKLLDEKDLKAGKERVGRIVSMLVKLARSCEDA